jgi:hypothetical protein
MPLSEALHDTRLVSSVLSIAHIMVHVRPRHTQGYSVNGETTGSSFSIS